jgi:hypothetical protein
MVLPVLVWAMSLWAGSLPSAAPTFTISPTPTVTMGFEWSYQQFGSSGGSLVENNPGALYFSPITIPNLVPGLFQAIVSAGAHFNPGATGSYAIALYADNAGTPGTLISQSAVSQAVPGWNWQNLNWWGYAGLHGEVWVAVWVESASTGLFNQGVPDYAWPSYRMDGTVGGNAPAAFDPYCSIPYPFVRFDILATVAFDNGNTATPTPSPSPTPSACGPCTQTFTVSPTPTLTPYVACAPSATWTYSPTPCGACTLTVTLSATKTPTLTPSLTANLSLSTTPSPSMSPTPTRTMNQGAMGGVQAVPAVAAGGSLVWPSPARGKSVHFGFNMTGPGTATVQVINSGGGLLGKNSAYAQAGPASLSFDISGYAPGIYYYRISIGYDSGASAALEVKAFAVAP